MSDGTEKIREDGLEEDKLFKTHKKLRYKWQWADIRHLPPNSNSSQVSFAKVYDWTLNAVHWTSEYEACIIYNGERIASEREIKTRLDAQIKAEELLVTWLKEEYLKLVMRKGVPEQIELGQDINKNRVFDNLSDLGREFCKNFDRLLAVYKRIMIRAFTIKEEKEALFKEDKKAVTKLLKEEK